MEEAEKEARLAATTRRQRVFVYGLIGGQHCVNLLVRFGLPFFVPFMVQEYALSEAQRAACLAAFTPGYMVTQIPAAPLIRRVGPKIVLVANNLGMPLLLLALPAAAAVSPGALIGCIAAIGGIAIAIAAIGGGAAAAHDSSSSDATSKSTTSAPSSMRSSDPSSMR